VETRLRVALGLGWSAFPPLRAPARLLTRAFLCGAGYVLRRMSGLLLMRTAAIPKACRRIRFCLRTIEVAAALPEKDDGSYELC
jgi:hypothetical protein